MSDDQAVESFLVALRANTDDAGAQERIEQNILRYCGKAATPALIRALKTEARNPAWRIAWMLGELGDPDAVSALVEILERGQEPDVRSEAAHALGKIRHPGAVPALMHAVECQEESSTVRLSAIQALGRIGDERALPVVRVALRETGQMRDEAIEALGAIKDADSVGDLVLALQDSEFRTRALAAQALAAIGARAAVTDVQDALANEEDEWARKEMQAALGTLESQAPTRKWWLFWK